jgi:hypothetical protein
LCCRNIAGTVCWHCCSAVWIPGQLSQHDQRDHQMLRLFLAHVAINLSLFKRTVRVSTHRVLRPSSVQLIVHADRLRLLLCRDFLWAHAQPGERSS